MTTDLLDITFRSSVILAAVLVTSGVLRRRSAALRHAVLTAGLISALVMAPLDWILPEWHVPVAASETTQAEAVTAAHIEFALDASAEQPSSWSWLTVIAFVWGVGIAVGACGLLTGLLRLARLTRNAILVQDGALSRLTEEAARRHAIRRPALRLTEDAPGLVAAWGWWRPCLLLPARASEWPAAWVRVAVAHECAHIRRRDWPVQMLADLFRVVFWFNPLAWLIAARLRRESDRACDDAVLTTGIRSASYADHLVNIARVCRKPAWVPVVSMARSTNLEERITAMLNPQIDRRVPGRRGAALLAALLIAVVLPLASFDASAQVSPGPFTGFVFDPSGGVLPGVTVVLQDSNQLTDKTMTDGMGRFQFLSVAPGRYILEVSLPGFRSLRNEFELRDRGQWNRVITLQLGTIEETITVRGQRRPATTTARPVTPVRVGGAVKPPMKIANVNPVYPPAMLDAGLEGVVPMEALIDADGYVISVRVVSADVHPAFARAAEEAVRQWQFTPTLLNGQAVEVRMGVTVRFSLSDQ